MIAAADEQAARAKSLSDRDLIAAYNRTSGEPGDPEVEALIAEIQRRDLDL